ncbi:hypothetical protein D3C78_975210 [compost metagenome]
MSLGVAVGDGLGFGSTLASGLVPPPAPGTPLGLGVADVVGVGLVVGIGAFKSAPKFVVYRH